MRRRVRYLRRVRELLLRDLGGFFYEVHRTAGGRESSGHRAILETKTGRLAAIDGELAAARVAPRRGAPRADGRARARHRRHVPDVRRAVRQRRALVRALRDAADRAREDVGRRGRGPGDHRAPGSAGGRRADHRRGPEPRPPSPRPPSPPSPRARSAGRGGGRSWSRISVPEGAASAAAAEAPTAVEGEPATSGGEPAVAASGEQAAGEPAVAASGDPVAASGDPGGRGRRTGGGRERATGGSRRRRAGGGRER